VVDRAELPELANPFAVAEKACEFGDGWSCAFLADQAREGACGVGWEEFAPDAAKVKAYEAKARPLLEARCAGTGPACDRLIEVARAGCDGAVDVERARRLVARKLEGDAGACRGGDGKACLGLFDACRNYGELAAGSDEGAKKEAPAGPVPSAPLRAITTVASSVLPPWKGYRFGAEQVGDGALDTSWQPLDKKRGGVGQWLELDLGGDFVVSGLRLGNGLQRKDALGDLFTMNNRARRVLLSFDGGATEHVELGPDERGLVERRFAARVTRKVRVPFQRFTGARSGTTWRCPRWSCSGRRTKWWRPAPYAKRRRRTSKQAASAETSRRAGAGATCLPGPFRRRRRRGCMRSLPRDVGRPRRVNRGWGCARRRRRWQRTR